MRGLSVGVGVLVVASVALVAGVSSQPAPGAPADAAAGGADFSVRCAFCHGDAGAGGQGPSLIGVVGRKAGSVPGFAYTDALSHADIVWTPATLDRFLTDPAAVAPGTAMPMTVPDAAQRRNLIAYLGTLH